MNKVADKKERKGRRAYLNDFREDINGQYVYEGDRYTLDEEGISKKTLDTRLWLMTAVIAAGTVAGGCVPASCMLNCFYCILPFAGEAIAVFTLVWAMVKYSNGGEELRGYIYEKSVGVLPQRTFLAAFFAALGFAGVIIYIIINGFEGTAALTVIYLIIKVIVAICAWLMHKTVLSLKWKVNGKTAEEK